TQAPGEAGGAQAQPLPAAHEVELGGPVRFLESRRLSLGGPGTQPALLCGLDEPDGVRLLLFTFGPSGAPALTSQAMVLGGAELCGFDLDVQIALRDGLGGGAEAPGGAGAPRGQQ